jgi:hypothetical protein
MSQEELQEELLVSQEELQEDPLLLLLDLSDPRLVGGVVLDAVSRE